MGNNIEFAVKMGVPACFGMVTGVEKIHLNVLRWIENICWFILIIVFLTNRFECFICANPCFRMIMIMNDENCDWDQNMAVLTFVIIVSVSLIFEVILWINLRSKSVWNASYYVNGKNEKANKNQRVEKNHVSAMMGGADWMTGNNKIENKDQEDEQNEVDKKDPALFVPGDSVWNTSDINDCQNEMKSAMWMMTKEYNKNNN